MTSQLLDVDRTGTEAGAAAVIMLPGRYFVSGCAAAAILILVLGRSLTLPPWVLAGEVLATILGLFFFGSFKYQIHKNALTYGMLLVILASFTALPSSVWHEEVSRSGWSAWIGTHLLTFHGLDELIHADTMLFILGLTFFVSVIAQTRLLEGITFGVLRRNNGAMVPTVIAITAVVAFASGILDGVSMIGLTIRTLCIVLLLAGASTASIRYSVMVCTTVTTICGMWLAYGEPPNLIMKANLHPLLDNMFFLRYCAPVAVASYIIIAWNLRRRLGARRIDMKALDILDANLADVRFLQATRHGEVFTPIELVQSFSRTIGDRTDGVMARIRQGQSLGLAMVREGVPPAARRAVLAHYLSEGLADSVDRHYVFEASGKHADAVEAERAATAALALLGPVRRRAQLIGALSLLPFIAMLALHGLHHEFPLFPASFAGFFVAMVGIAHIGKMRRLALTEARHEYAEYYFLFPLFLSITLLTKAGFFDQMQSLVQAGIRVLGPAHVAAGQFLGSTFLSAILDNNVVADFASRGLHNLDINAVHLFAMAQIAGYALGGCWTHIGSAQSVVAYAFIQRDVDAGYTPVQWIKEMTPVICQILVLVAVLIYCEHAIMEWMSS